MDGNGRWAKKRMLPRVAGHRAGAEAVRRTIRAAAEAGVEVLTLYAFSSENWRRPAEEIGDLMGLLKHFLQAELDEFARNGLRLRLIGDYRRFSDDIIAMLDEAVARTAGNERMTVAIALNYGAHAELAAAARAIAADALAGTLDLATIDPEAIEARLDTAGLPPLDLLIRTSGEQRLSNFLLWQAAYAELMFLDTLWPDFDGEALRDCIARFHGRERRFGGR
jgi:undecaprenyl diphosphate synthase